MSRLRTVRPPASRWARRHDSTGCVQSRRAATPLRQYPRTLLLPTWSFSPPQSSSSTPILMRGEDSGSTPPPCNPVLPHSPPSTEINTYSARTILRAPPSSTAPRRDESDAPTPTPNYPPPSRPASSPPKPRVPRGIGRARRSCRLLPRLFPRRTRHTWESVPRCQGRSDRDGRVRRRTVWSRGIFRRGIRPTGGTESFDGGGWGWCCLHPLI
mmetsp:Transcript_21526/g.63058  ORF Transcript_21526/g.63058 Transcript_21526/m.63058 type:complete len:213 (-) Transcript_21526:2701-3339(-)